MDIENRLMEHYKRWDIELSYEEQFVKFKNRITSDINESIGDFLASNNNVDKNFSKNIKLHQANKPKVKKSYPVPNQIALLPQRAEDIFNVPFMTEKGFGDTQVYREIDNTKTSQDLAIVLQILLWALQEDEEGKDIIPHLLERVRKVGEMTPSVSFNILERDGEVIIYPHGEKILDQEVVDYVISGLEDYPDAAKLFVQALKIYQSGDTTQYRSLLDNLRAALEQLWKKVLNNEKSLEKQHTNRLIKDWLKEKGLHEKIYSLYDTLLNRYIDYQNNAVKHNEKYSLDEVEFMIYLTATFMRLIIQLVNEDLTEVDSQDVI